MCYHDFSTLNSVTVYTRLSPFSCFFLLLMCLFLLVDVCSLHYLVWEGSSVWDLPIDTAAQGPALEQLQQLEKAKAAKVRNCFIL